jgi:hypothetical protein
MNKYKKGTGWYNYGSKHESIRHGLSARGISTGRKSKIDYSFGLPAFKKISDNESKSISKSFTKSLGDSIVSDIKALNNKYIADVSLDDFNSDSGYLIITLKMEDMKPELTNW